VSGHVEVAGREEFSWLLPRHRLPALLLLLFVDIVSPPPRLPEVAGGVTSSCHKCQIYAQLLTLLVA
jgi:hypothetical protein